MSQIIRYMSNISRNVILSRSKTWEIRGTPCKKHIGKRIALIQCGMKGKKSRIVGGVTIVGSKEIKSDQEFRDTVNYHQCLEKNTLPYKKTFAYILENVIRLDEEIEIDNKKGVVIWRTLDELVLV